eukprot:1512916-Pyramimonas_sp.AAC.1
MQCRTSLAEATTTEHCRSTSPARTPTVRDVRSASNSGGKKGERKETEQERRSRRRNKNACTWPTPIGRSAA